MPQKVRETIIIGAGIAGIACAQKLSKHKKDFLVISEDVCGRIMSSADESVNYGAYFVLENYNHILPFVEKREKLHPFFIEFHGRGKRYYHLIRMSAYPRQLLRLLLMLNEFKSEYENFKKACEKKSQKCVIEESEYIKALYFKVASDFVKEKGIEDIARKFLSEGVYMCTFLGLEKVSAFDFMRLCLSIILEAHEFKFLKEKAIKSFKKNIVTDSVTKLKKAKYFEIKTKSGETFKARNVVVATPTNISKKLLNIKKTKSGANSYMFHIEGQLKDDWTGGQFELFNSASPVIFIRKESNGTYIFYSKIPNPDLKKYFKKARVIAKKSWTPAFNLTGDTLLESDFDKNLYLIGDHNVSGMEDTYITGIYAANKIILAS